MEFTDSKLDEYITKIKDPATSNADVLVNYKKASKRIDILKTKYNKLTVKEESETETDSEEANLEALSIEDLLIELAKIRVELETENTDISNLIKLYSKYNSLIKIIKIKSTDLQNKFYKVDSNKKDITVSKVDLLTIL